MQRIETILARVVLFADIKELNPGGLSLQQIHRGLIKRYNFLDRPKSEANFDDGVRYGGGEFEYEDKRFAVYLTIYSSGWVVETLVSTEVAEAFWNDVAEWVASIGFRNANELVSKRIYESQLVVQADLDLTKKFGNFDQFVKIISELSGDSTEQFGGIYVSADNAPLSTFTFERRVNTPFSENKYFSRASLPTSKHLHALEEFEKLLR